MLCIQVSFEVDEEASEVEPLRMEHFYLPIGILVAGIFISFFCFLAEIIIHRIRKSQSEVAVLRVEEPKSSQITVEDIEEKKV